MIQVEHDTLAYCGPILRERVRGAIRVLTGPTIPGVCRFTPSGGDHPGSAAARAPDRRLDVVALLDANPGRVRRDRRLHRRRPRGAPGARSPGPHRRDRPRNRDPRTTAQSDWPRTLGGRLRRQLRAPAERRRRLEADPLDHAPGSRAPGRHPPHHRRHPPAGGARPGARARRRRHRAGAPGRAVRGPGQPAGIPDPARRGDARQGARIARIGEGRAASPLAIAGLEVESAKQVRIAESDDEFADAIVALLEDEPGRRELAENAREWAQRNLGWDERVERYEALYRSLSRRRRSVDRAPSSRRGRSPDPGLRQRPVAAGDRLRARRAAHRDRPGAADAGCETAPRPCVVGRGGGRGLPDR